MNELSDLIRKILSIKSYNDGEKFVLKVEDLYNCIKYFFKKHSHLNGWNASTKLLQDKIIFISFPMNDPFFYQGVDSQDSISKYRINYDRVFGKSGRNNNFNQFIIGK